MRHDEHNFTTSLPFPSQIDWGAASLWLAPVVRTSFRSQQCAREATDWLEGWLSPSEHLLPDIRSRGLAAFRDHLDYVGNPAGVVSSILREVALRLPACSRHGTRRARARFTPLAGGSVDSPGMCPWAE